MSLSVAGVRRWILAGLCFSVSVRAGEDVAASQCAQSFHKGAPPTGFGGERLQLLCHSPDGAWPFATLYDASSDVTVYLAFNVAGGLERTGSEGDGQVRASTGVSVALLGFAGIVVLLPVLVLKRGRHVPTSFCCVVCA